MTEKTTPLWATTDTPALKPLDVLLEEVAFQAAEGWDARRFVVLLERMGWSGDYVPTLEEAGQKLDLTRERVRQLQSKLDGRIRKSRRLPRRAIAAAITELSTPTPAATEPIEHLVETGFLARRISPRGLRLAADMVGLKDDLENVLAGWEAWDLIGEGAMRIAKGLARGVGLLHVDWVCEQSTLSRTAVVGRLRRDVAFRDLGSGWWREEKYPRGRNRLENVTRRILAVHSPVTLDDAREGAERVYRLRRQQYVPSTDGLARFYSSHTDFTLVGNEVGSAAPISMADALDDTERVFAEVLLSDPDGVMDREELRTRVVGRGVNVNTFSAYSSYSPVLKHLGQDLWTFRGNVPSPAVLRLYRRKRRERTTSYEWTPLGHLLVRYALPNEESPVVGFPSAVRRLVAHREFGAVDGAGSVVGRIRVDEAGLSWGYGGFTQAEGAVKADVLELEIDLTLGRMTLRIIKREPSEVAVGRDKWARGL